MKQNNRRTIALLLAGGIGSRTNLKIPKQFVSVNDKPVLIYTLEAFQECSSIDDIIVVCLKGWEETLREYAEQFNITKLKWIVNGGKDRQESTEKGLAKLKEECNKDDIIIIHDANRALVDEHVISDSISTFYKYGSAIAAIPSVDTILKSDDGIVSYEQVPREQLFRTQTPHVYTLEKLLWAHEEAEKKGIENTTALCSLMQLLGEKVYFSKGSEKNFKITTLEDFELFKAFVNCNSREDFKV